MTDPVKQKIIELVPEIEGKHLFEPGSFRCKFCKAEKVVRDRKVLNRVVDERTGGSSQEVEVTDYLMEGGPCPDHASRPITLGDVLRAIEEVPRHITPLMVVQPPKNTWWDKQQAALLKKWNFSLDYDSQTPEVKAFVGKILGV